MNMQKKGFFQSTPGNDLPEITIRFNGIPLQVPSGTSVAAALLIGGVAEFRTTPVSGSARSPLCMMGVCFDCLVEINGRPNCQSCLMTVQENMDVRTQEGAANYE